MKGVSSACLMGMALMTCADVILRATINKPIFGSEEIVSIFAVLAIGFALPYAHKKDSHVGVEIVVRLLSKRTQEIIRLVTNAFSFLLFLLLAWQMFIYARVMQGSGELSMNLELPTYCFVYALSFCLFVVSLHILQDMLLYFNGDRS
ncbi:MAG: TRAP transporter small permease [Desulfofustis sp.]|jgi:TRAP-type transport system small permease protein